MIAAKKQDENMKWVSPPGETIIRLVHEKKINLFLLLTRMKLSSDSFHKLLQGRISIDQGIAFKLSKFLGGSEQFWINRFTEFNEFSSESNNSVKEKYSDVLTKLSQKRNTTIEKLLDDFKIPTFEYLVNDYFHQPKIMYSKTSRFEPSPIQIANWIRNCELIGEQIILSEPVRIFSHDVLYDTIPQVLELTKVNSVNKILEKLKSLLIKSGIVLIFSPSEKGNGVSGFTKKLFKRYRLIVITDRYKNNASFWLTLLHEIAHCLLHKIDSTIVHFSDDEFRVASLPTNDIYEEIEADDFVQNLLFPDEVEVEIKKVQHSYKAIMKLAVKFDMSAALIVSRIHRLKIAPFSHYRRFYRKVNFETIS